MLVSKIMEDEGQKMVFEPKEALSDYASRVTPTMGELETAAVVGALDHIAGIGGAIAERNAARARTTSPNFAGFRLGEVEQGPNGIGPDHEPGGDIDPVGDRAVGLGKSQPLADLLDRHPLPPSGT